ncbi:MAG: 4Fe-4S binding protein [Coriobacteriales bacterium]|jgi:NADH-quinone oxidoreductase subunit F|nr:4Fe-4S binding protein [Coriobacteriales bacterium]
MAENTRKLLVCCDTGCLANNARAVADALEAALAAAGLDVAVERGSAELKRTGCIGQCSHGPIVKVHPDDICYYRVKPKHAEKIVASLGGEPYQPLLYRDFDGEPKLREADNPFYAHQKKIALRHVGLIDPLSLDDYLEAGGYEALKKALTMEPQDIINEIKASGLRGRGGAGFLTGNKWQAAASYPAQPKYVVCNGDEGDPGAFMDRSLLEGDPHSVIEGLIIAALAVGAEQGYLYIRDEYELALPVVATALKQAEAAGYLGSSIQGSGRKLHLEIVRGGGAFVCGESSALMASIEGRVGEPRSKYIRSVERGLWDKPTVLNNVETLANVPFILSYGSGEFAKIGTAGSKGTKVFSLVGKVKRSGLVEVPMGITLRSLIFDIGGGIADRRSFKAIQTGGPSGGCLPESLLDLEVDFESLTDHHTMVGSGGMIVMDDRSCMVEVAHYYVDFLCGESCGKCTPCREGLRHMREILENICKGQGKASDLEELEDLAFALQEASLCGLGKTAANPVLSTLRYFPEEYEAHIKERRCPAGVCKPLTLMQIDQEACTSCRACLKACPLGSVKETPAASPDQKATYHIDPALCTACGSCREACRFEAVVAVRREATCA